MKPAPFLYARPHSLAEALQCLALHGDGAKILAGGQSLVPLMNTRAVRPKVVVDINAIPDLDTISRSEHFLHIGAMARHRAVRSSALVRDCAPLIAMAYEHLAHRAVQNRGTFCGNLCQAPSVAEMPAVALALGASMVMDRVGGRREVGAHDFFLAGGRTCLAADEVLTEVKIPLPTVSWHYGFQEISVRRAGPSLAAVAACISLQDGVIAQAALAYAGIADRVVRDPAVEAVLIGKAATDDILSDCAAFASQTLPVMDEYRQGLVQTLTHRALAQAATQ